MYKVEERDLFGNWQAVEFKAFETELLAYEWCLFMADQLNIAYRILFDGEVVKVVDLEASFWAFLDGQEKGVRPDQ